MTVKPNARRSVYLPSLTADMLSGLAEAIGAIAPWDRQFERQSRREKLSMSEVAECAIWKGARQLAEENGIEFRWSKHQPAR